MQKVENISPRRCCRLHQRKRSRSRTEYGENDDSELIFYCFHFALHLYQQTLSAEKIQNKNASQWIQNLTSDATISYDGACINIFKLTGHSLQGMRNFPGWRS